MVNEDEKMICVCLNNVTWINCNFRFMTIFQIFYNHDFYLCISDLFVKILYYQFLLQYDYFRLMCRVPYM